MTGAHQRLCDLKRMLMAHGEPWSIELGRKHIHVIVNGRRIGVVSYSSDYDRDFYFIERALRGERQADE